MRFLIYALIALSPLPLASARPAWQWLWIVVIGLIAIITALQLRHTKKSDWPSGIWLPASLISIFAAWGFLQAYLPVSNESALGNLPSFSTISVNPALTLNNAIFFLAHLIFFVCVYAYCTRRDKAANILKFIAIVVGIYAAYGFAIYVSGNQTILWFDKWANQNSLTSTFVNRNSYAAYAGIGLQCLIAYAFFWTQAELAEGRTGRELYRHVIETMLVKAWWLPLAIILTTSALLLTNSRAGFSSVAVGVFLLLVLSPNRYQKNRKSTIKSIVIIFGLVAVAVSLFALSGDNLDQRLQSDASLDMRFKAYPYMIDAIFNKPLTGYGLGTFEEIFRVYREADVTANFDRAHNDYLELALTAGIPAAIILIIACILPLFTLIGALKFGAQYRSFIALGITATIQLGLHSFVDFSLQMPAVSYTWLAILSASLAIAVRCKKAASVDL